MTEAQAHNARVGGVTLTRESALALIRKEASAADLDGSVRSADPAEILDIPIPDAPVVAEVAPVSKKPAPPSITKELGVAVTQEAPPLPAVKKVPPSITKALGVAVAKVAEPEPEPPVVIPPTRTIDSIVPFADVPYGYGVDETPPPGTRYHSNFLENMHGIFLVRYDSQSRIIGFFGGALRVLGSEEKTDAVYTLTPERLFEAGVRKGEQPELEVLALVGRARQGEFKVCITDYTPYTEKIKQVVTRHDPEAWVNGAWGILTVCTKRGKRWFRDRINTSNSEEFISSETWNSLDTNQIVAGMGASSLGRRLSPLHEKITAEMPTVWQLAVTAGMFYGGLSEDIPRVRMRDSAVVHAIATRERDMHRTKKAERAAKRLASRQGELRRPEQSSAVQEAIDPTTIARMAGMVAQSTSSVPEDGGPPA